MNKNQVIIPHILILDEDNMDKFTPQNLLPIIEVVNKNLKEDKELTHGMVLATIDSGEEIALSWHTNYYHFDIKNKLGVFHSEDMDKITTEVIRHLLDVSLDLSVNDADELMAEFDEGTLDIKFGTGKNKRIYKISYELVHSNLESALEQIEESISLYEEELIQNDDLSPKRTLH